MKIFRPAKPAVQGFTLIELSIVLVIIGLLVGGILAGRELINAARIRSQISQLNAFNLAVNTFMGKYNGLPGDINAGLAASVGMESRSGADGHGDGDGNLEACTWSIGNEYSDAYFNCETALFWRDLSYEKLIPHELNAAIDGVNVIDSTNIDLYLPRSKLNTAAQISVYSPYRQFSGWKLCPGLYCFSIASIAATDSNGLYFLTPALTAEQTYQIDAKMDDGLPDTGTVVGGRTGSPFGNSLAARPASGTRCQNADAANTYNVNEGNLTNLNSMHCVINVSYK